jgi:hypothetical protein
MERNPMRIRKVHLSSFIEILTALYNKGVDYIDIMSVESEDEKQDGLGVSFKREYMNVEMAEGFDDMPTVINAPTGDDNKLTDNDLNQLI